MMYSRPFLETFLAVCQQRNFSQAANALGKSQACVSMQIAQMERELGLALFNRAARPFTITDAGTKFAEFAKVIVGTMDECQSYMKGMVDGSAGELSIGALPSLVVLLVSPVIAGVAKAFPNAKIQITAFAPPALYEAIRQREIDFGILLAKNTPPEFNVTPIRTEPIYFVRSATHPSTNKRRSLSIKELRETPLVLGSPEYDYTMLVDQSLREIGVDRYKVAMRINNFQGVIKAVRSGIGLGILPRFTVQDELKQGTLHQVHVKEANFSSQIVLIENRKVLSLPTVENIKRIFVKELAKAG